MQRKSSLIRDPENVMKRESQSGTITEEKKKKKHREPILFLFNSESLEMV